MKNKTPGITRVVVFGSFDIFHPGHEAFLAEARKYGDELIVLLAQDEVIEAQKKQPAMYSFSDRKARIESCRYVDCVKAGDPLKDLGTYKTLLSVQPDYIVLGYDQEALEEHVRTWCLEYLPQVSLQKAQPFKPELYKSSLLRNV